MRAIICENDAAMDTMTLLQPPAATAFDAVSSLLAAAVYLLVAFAALAHAPRDPRVRIFLVTAAASAPPYCLTALIWERGAGAALSKPVLLIVAVSLMVGSLALLHFAQLFPWRRPWIRAHGRWLTAGYATVAALAILAAFLTPPLDNGDGLGAMSASSAELLVLMVVVVGIPALFLFGLVVPFAGVLSLYKSWLAARAHAGAGPRVTTLWMLISQMGGGVLAIVIIPLLRIAAPRGPWVTMAAALLFGCSMLMPAAFAAGIWKLGVLDLDIEALPQ
jgi:hypothetical protein